MQSEPCSGTVHGGACRLLCGMNAAPRRGTYRLQGCESNVARAYGTRARRGGPFEATRTAGRTERGPRCGNKARRRGSATPAGCFFVAAPRHSLIALQRMPAHRAPMGPIVQPERGKLPSARDRAYGVRLAPAAAACLGGSAAATSTATAAAHIARATAGESRNNVPSSERGPATERDERTEETGRIPQRGALRQLFRKRILLLGKLNLFVRQYAILLRQHRKLRVLLLCHKGEGVLLLGESVLLLGKLGIRLGPLGGGGQRLCLQQHTCPAHPQQTRIVCIPLRANR